jgi:hypothetical protein
MSDSEGEVDEKQEVEEKETKGGKSGKKLEVKKWNAVALWAWGSFYDTKSDSKLANFRVLVAYDPSPKTKN